MKISKREKIIRKNLREPNRNVYPGKVLHHGSKDESDTENNIPLTFVSISKIQNQDIHVLYEISPEETLNPLMLFFPFPVPRENNIKFPEKLQIFAETK